MSIKKKVFSAVLITAITMSLSGCGNQEKKALDELTMGIKFGMSEEKAQKIADEINSSEEPIKLSKGTVYGDYKSDTSGDLKYTGGKISFRCNDKGQVYSVAITSLDCGEFYSYYDQASLAALLPNNTGENDWLDRYDLADLFGRREDYFERDDGDKSKNIDGYYLEVYQELRDDYWYMDDGNIEVCFSEEERTISGKYYYFTIIEIINNKYADGSSQFKRKDEK